jgi:hypothetical protein
LRIQWRPFRELIIGKMGTHRMRKRKVERKETLNAVSKSRNSPESDQIGAGTPLGLGLTLADTGRNAVQQVQMVGDSPLQVQLEHCQY